MNLKKTLKSTDETRDFAFEIANDLKGKIILLNGNLGAGKTFFVKAIAEFFKCEETSSPTFTLHQKYTGEETINHFDLYRLESPHELDNIDFYEIAENGDTCFVEWAEKFNFKDELEEYIEINIYIVDSETRIFEVKG
jgi:tRNA threonylcarbamoyladenosine biosynthesis protein TsaE